MSKKRKIEHILRDAPSFSAPEGLLEKLQEDVSVSDSEKHRSILRDWFAPSGQFVSRRRVACAAAIGFFILLPLTYAAGRIVKRIFVVQEFHITYSDDNGMYTYGVSTHIASDTITTKDEARKAHKEMLRLIKEGKAEEISPGVYKGTLSNGEEFCFATEESLEIDLAQNREERLKEQFDEIEKLRKAGEFERIFKEEIVKDGIKIHLYEDRFTLSNGKVVTMIFGEAVKDEKK